MTDATKDTKTQTEADSALANWQAQSAPLANYAAEAQTMLDETQRALGALWEKAELEGDEAAKQMISDSWQRAQALHSQVVHMDAGLAGAGTTIQTLDEQRRAALDELKSIIDAIEEGDENHPQLQEFAQDIRMDEYEYAAEMEFDYIDDTVREQLYEEMDARIREIFGKVEWQTEALADFIYNNVEPSPQSKALFRQFIESLHDSKEETA